jgi:hypothetical protein
MDSAKGLASLLVFSLLGSRLTATAAPAPHTPNTPPTKIVLPAGIADPTGHTGFFASASGGIDAVELKTGKILWQTHEAQIPLLVDGNHLLAQAGVKRNRLRILRLDLTRQGESDLESDPIVFPAWVVTGEGYGRSFQSHWRLEKRQLVLEWAASAWHTGPTKPTPEQEKAARKHAAGSARIDLRTGQVEVGPAEKTTQPLAPALPEHLERKSVRWQGLVGGDWRVVTLEEVAGQQRLILHSCDQKKGKTMESKELLKGKRLLLRPSLDERFLCLREDSPDPGERGSLMPRKSSSCWLLVSSRTGELVGHIPHEAGMHAIVLLGDRVYYLVSGASRGPLDQPNIHPRILRATELSSGKLLWERPVAGKLVSPPPI